MIGHKKVPKLGRAARAEVSVNKRHVGRGTMAEDLRPMFRRADLTPGTFNEDAMTVEAVLSTYADVQRVGYIERLDPAGLDDRDLIGAPFLDSHKQSSGAHVIGVIQAVRHEAGQLLGTIRLVQSDDARPIVDRIKGGYLRGVSLGYRVKRWVETTNPAGQKVRTAAAWSVFEVSAVPVPADPGAKFRGLNMAEDNDELEGGITTPMPDAQQTQIRSLGELADLPPSWARSQIVANATVKDARRSAQEQLVERSRPAQRIRVQASAHEDPAVRLRTMEDALFARTNGGTPTDAARPFMSHTLRDFARETLHLRGVATTGMDTDALFRAAMHTTSDFPNLLQGVGARTLLPAYQAAQSPLKSVLSRQATRTDFRPGSKLRLGEIGLLEKVNEAGEIKSTTRAESVSSYAIDTFARMFTISRKALINDDLGAFRDWSIAAGQAAAQTEAALLFSLLTGNGGAGPKMDDGKPMFSADHGNLNAAPNGTSLNHTNSLKAARLALRTMKGFDGKTPIQVTPKYLMVGPQRETEAEKLLTAVNATELDGVNPFAGKLTLLVEPRILGFDWYCFADPAQFPALEYAYLSGAPGPQFASREGFDVLATEFRVLLDFGAGAVDWRGAYHDVGNDNPDF